MQIHYDLLRTTSKRIFESYIWNSMQIKNSWKISPYTCVFFPSYVAPKPIYDHFMSIIGSGLFFLWAFCRLGFSGRDEKWGLKPYRDREKFWSETRGVLPVMAYTPKLRPKGVHFSGFRKGMFASSSCKFQRPGIKVWHDSDRASISPSDSIRPVPDPDFQIGGGGGHPDSEIKGGPGLKKKFFSALRASFWSKTKGAPDSPAPLP